MKRPKVFNTTIDPNICFECGGEVQEMHHVVPVVLGGTRVIPLCEECHGKVHNLNREGHGYLIKSALAAKRSRGERVGATPYGTMAEGNALAVHPVETSIIRRLKELRSSGLTLRAVIEQATAEGLCNRAGKPFTMAAVHKLVKDAA